MKLEDIRLRDPFILPVEEEQVYYLYGTNCGNVPGNAFPAFRSKDLKHWEGPFTVFSPEKDFWADRDFWAPEVHVYDGRYFMFASFKASDGPRGTQILVADSPLGPFRPWSAGPLTPSAWECLDGTLYIDRDGVPWMVFCHEWLQVQDGGMCAMKLTSDLQAAAGGPKLLFNASDAPWAHREKDQVDFVTDGPFLVRLESGELIMLWSSFGVKGYALGIADSVSGEITGPWKQRETPFYADDGGHAMLFKTFDGTLMLSLHSPNESPKERPKLIPINVTDLMGDGD